MTEFGKTPGCQPRKMPPESSGFAGNKGKIEKIFS
jgi:hypothetical protein